MKKNILWGTVAGLLCGSVMADAPQPKPNVLFIVVDDLNTEVGLIDLYPTLCELARLELPAGLDGTSLAGMIRGKKQDHAPVLTVFGPDNFALRSERWRYIHYADGSEELYDHRNDPDEHSNLAGNPEYEPILEEFRPQIPKKSVPFVPGSSGLASSAFPGK